MSNIEQCDSCIARATNVICFPNGLKLFLCTHHTNRFKPSLENQGAIIYSIEDNNE